LSELAVPVMGMRTMWSHASRQAVLSPLAFLAWLDRECGGYESLRAGGDDFVIVQTQCRYLAPARLGDRIDLAVRPVSVGKRSSFTLRSRWPVTARS
jgi:hypothetical protein